MLESCDDGQQARFHGAVHLDHAVAALGPCLGDEASGIGELLLVLGQEVLQGRFGVEPILRVLDVAASTFLRLAPAYRAAEQP